MKMFKHAVFAVFVSIMVIVVSCVQSTDAPYLTGKIVLVTGNVSVNGKPAKIDDPIKFGDVIATKVKSQCRIVIDERNIIAMWDNSTLVFKLKKGDGLLEVKNGYVGAVMKNFKNIKEFRVVTPTVAAGIRGTAFCIAVEKSEETYSCVCNGKIGFKTASDEKEQMVEAPHHKANYYIKEGEKIIIKEAGLKFHDDKKIEKLAGIIGVTIDWTKTE